MNKKIASEITIGIVLVFVIITVILIWSRNNKQANCIKSAIPTPAPQQANQNKSDLTTMPSDWQAYTNYLYGFEIRYPIGWSVKEYGNLKSFEIVREQENIQDQFDVNFSKYNNPYDCFVTDKGSIKLGNYDWEMKIWEKGFTQGECGDIERQYPKNKPVLYLQTQVNGKNIGIIIGDRKELDNKDKEVISTIRIFKP